MSKTSSASAALVSVAPFFIVASSKPHSHFSRPLADTDDGLRGFEITYADGYVLFFGRPR